jgi:bla regulator protein blaR1
MTGVVAIHLWQSTVCAGVLALLALAFRRQQAQVRYWIWFAASLKFLVPFTLLVAAGSQLHWRTAIRQLTPEVVSTSVMEMSEPFLSNRALDLVAPSEPRVPEWPARGFLGIWLGGLTIMVAVRWRHWRRIRAIVRLSTPSGLTDVNIPSELDVREAPCCVEPAVVGWRQPIVLLPRDLPEYLTPSQLEAVLAHELCHVRRKDNLTAALHMVVESLFWFYPVVWWIGGRMLAEREIACDEAVLSTTNDRQGYAEAILAICQRYVQIPLACAPGVGGANLRSRIENIIRNQIGIRLTLARKVTLAAIAATALGLPVFAGAMQAPAGHERRHAIDEQTPSTFEVASIKRNSLGGRPDIARQPGGRLTVTNMTARTLMTFAYRLTGYQLVGGPAWTDRDTFDIVARTNGNPGWSAPGSLLPDPTQVAMQALLADRFKLKLHKEQREMDVFALEMVKPGTPGPGLMPSTSDCAALAEDARQGKSQPTGPPPATGYVPCSILGNVGMIRFDGFGMPQVANMLIGQAGRIVIDHTNLVGNWQFVLRFAAEQRAPVLPGADLPPADPNAPSLSTALREQLGLKLERAKAIVDVTVIDSIDHPTDD